MKIPATLNSRFGIGDGVYILIDGVYEKGIVDKISFFTEFSHGIAFEEAEKDGYPATKANRMPQYWVYDDLTVYEDEGRSYNMNPEYTILCETSKGINRYKRPENEVWDKEPDDNEKLKAIEAKIRKLEAEKEELLNFANN